MRRVESVVAADGLRRPGFPATRRWPASRTLSTTDHIVLITILLLAVPVIDSGWLLSVLNEPLLLGGGGRNKAPDVVVVVDLDDVHVARFVRRIRNPRALQTVDRRGYRAAAAAVFQRRAAALWSGGSVGER